MVRGSGAGQSSLCLKMCLQVPSGHGEGIVSRGSSEPIAWWDFTPVCVDLEQPRDPYYSPINSFPPPSSQMGFVECDRKLSLLC